MRILFTFVGGLGHFEPLVPLARGARAVGHTVAFGCARAMVPTVRTADFDVFALGAAQSGPPVRLPLRPVDRAREERDLRERFARRAARYRAPLVIELCRAWHPDVLVCDETDFGAMIAAERLRLPFAAVLVIAAGSFVRKEVVGDALAALRAEHGLAPDPDLEMLGRYLVLSPFPTSYRDPDFPLPATGHAFRAMRTDLAGAPVPPWSLAVPGAPTVYLTLGTVFNLESGDLLPRMIGALREMPINVIVTVGREIDPHELGPDSPNVHVERYVPQATVLPHCDLVVSHGGSGSVLGALAHGLPSVLLPLGADQPLNADRCTALGVAMVLDAMELTPAALRGAVHRVLGEPVFRRNAERLRDEIAALPDVSHAVGLLERLASEKRPLR